VIGSTQSCVLGPQDEPVVRDFLAEHPVDGCLIAARVQALGVGGAAGSSGELCAYYGESGVRAVWLDGPSLVLVGDEHESGAVVEALIQRNSGRPRRCSSIVGPAHLVIPLWNRLSAAWGSAREVRPDQPLLALDSEPRITPLAGVRRAARTELDILMPAAEAMFREEVGVDPAAGDRGNSYRARVAELIDTGRCLAWIENDQVLFKAELGAVSDRACQVQGIWVRPDLRGRGYGATGTAAVAAIALAEVAPVVSLYVNHFNTAARAAYARVGFSQVGTFATVLF